MNFEQFEEKKPEEGPSAEKEPQKAEVIKRIREAENSLDELNVELINGNISPEEYKELKAALLAPEETPMPAEEASKETAEKKPPAEEELRKKIEGVLKKAEETKGFKEESLAKEKPSPEEKEAEQKPGEAAAIEELEAALQEIKNGLEELREEETAESAREEVAEKTEEEMPSQEEIPEQEKESEKIFEDPETKTIFKRLTAKAKNFALGLYEKGKIDITDRVKIWWNKKLADEHKYEADKFSRALERVSERKNKIIENLENKKSDLERKLADIRERFGKKIIDPLTGKEVAILHPSIEQKARKEKKQLEEKIEEEKDKINKLLLKREPHKEKWDNFENKRRAIIEEDCRIIEKRLAPLGRKSRELWAKSDKLHSEINDLKSEKTKIEKSLTDLEQEVKKASFSFEKKALKEAFKQAKKDAKGELKEIDEFVKEMSDEAYKIDGRIFKIRDKEIYWLGKKETLEKMSRTEAGPETKMKIKDYLEKWKELKGQKDLFGRELKTEFKISEDDFKKYVEIWRGKSLDSNMDLNDFGGLLEDYFNSEKAKRKTSISKYGFKGLLGIFKDLLRIKAE